MTTPKSDTVRPPMSPRAFRVLSTVTVVLIAAIYVASAGRYVLGGDNGEFSTIGMLGGVAHPTGYPLYSIWLRLTSWIPGASAAHTAAIATALIGVAAHISFRQAARNWGASRGAAIVAATLLSISPLMWTMSTHAEVFALHALLASEIVRVSGPRFAGSSVCRVGLLALLAGLGLANNHSIVTMAPLGLCAVVRAIWTTRPRLRAIAAGVAGMAAGLSPYLYTYVVGRQEDAAIAWGETGTLAGLWHHFIRADYGTTQLAIGDAANSGVAHVVRLFAHLALELYVAPTVFVVVGITVMLINNGKPTRIAPSVSESSEAVPLPLHRRTVRESKRRSAHQAAPRVSVPTGLAWSYLLAILTTGPLFASRFNLAFEGLALTIVERFYLLPLVLLVVPLALGMDRIFSRALETLDVVGPTLVGVTCLGVFLSYDTVREHHRPDVEYYIVNSLWTAEDGAVIFGTGDHRLYGFTYAREVERIRPDVVYVDPMMLHYPWYEARVEAQLGFELRGIEEGRVDTRYLAQSAFVAGRPVYLTNQFSDAIGATFPTYPIGTLIRVLPQGHRPPPPDTLEEQNVAEALRYRYADTDPTNVNGWAHHVQQTYYRPWRVLADAYEAAGRFEDAARCRNQQIILPGSKP